MLIISPLDAAFLSRHDSQGLPVSFSNAQEGLWSCYALLCVLLGFNRCLDILCPVLYQLLFIGQRTWYWLLLPIVYGLYTGSPLQRPFVYNSRLGSWFISPLPGVPNAGGYTVLLQSCITCLILSVCTILYVSIQMWQLPDFMYVLSQITWQAISGSNSIVYLCLNRTIRRRVKARLCGSSKPSTRDERKHLFSFAPIIRANK
ncbi:unnamed protein product [Toxocara canis]|uniref:Uncharacterized protein n=1 Tax=Toxocara canis TaxID=6265 RepID=A0A183UGB8_TOXCA|nr:unnamed protein product [Toxocara canis]